MLDEGEMAYFLSVLGLLSIYTFKKAGKEALNTVFFFISRAFMVYINKEPIYNSYFKAFSLLFLFNYISISETHQKLSNYPPSFSYSVVSVTHRYLWR